MENDLIRRSDALAAFKESTSAMPEKQGRRRIEEIPAVDAVEVRHGEWEYTGVTDEWYGPVFRCKSCGGEMIGNPKFCSDCGARMDGEEEHNGE